MRPTWPRSRCREPTPATDLTRALAPVTLTSSTSALDGDGALDRRGRACGVGRSALTITVADLVGAMEGAIDTTCEYAKERQQYGVAIGSFQAVQHLLAEARVLLEGSISVSQYAAWAVDALPPDEALRRRRGGQGVLRTRRPHGVRDRRSRCTGASATPGSASCTCTCAGRCCRARCWATRATTCAALGAVSEWETNVDFDDSPEEAAFRQRIRAWLQDNNPGLPTSSTDDEYWARQAEWHCALFDAGFFALTWPKRIGGHELPPVYEVIVDDELAAAGAPAEAGSRVPDPGHHPTRQRRGVRPLPPRARSAAATAGARGSASPTPARIWRRCAPVRCSTATSTSSTGTRSGPATPTSPTGACCWLAPTPTSPKHKGISAFAVPMHQPGIEQRPLKMINGVTQRVRPGAVRRRAGARREHDRRAR